MYYSSGMKIFFKIHMAVHPDCDDKKPGLSSRVRTCVHCINNL